MSIFGRISSSLSKLRGGLTKEVEPIPRTSEVQPAPQPGRTTRLVGSGKVQHYPLVICFHGAGPSAAALDEWEAFAAGLDDSFQLLLYDRGDTSGTTQLSPQDSVSALETFLNTHHLTSPYILVAHSYGGCVARLFLSRHVGDIAGLVLVETGQEAMPSQQLEDEQYEDGGIMDQRPVSVIRGNSLIGKWREYKRSLSLADADADDRLSCVSLMQQKLFLESFDREDEKLKKKQLGLSRLSRYVHVPDCGHNVIRDRPDVVSREVKWVAAEWETQEQGLFTM